VRSTCEPVGYATRAAALDACEAQMEAGCVEPGCHVMPYPCERCGHWHTRNQRIVFTEATEQRPSADIVKRTGPMGLIELLIYVVVVTLIGWLAIWVLGQVAPGHPAVIDRIIWVVVVLIIVLVLVRAFGLVDPQVPRLR
jgi:hypothetical protein